MHAIVLKQYGGTEVLSYEDVERPSAHRGEVLIKVKAVSINHLDIWVRGGLTAFGTKLPHILGCDFSGEVAEVGPDVRDLKTGDRVFVDPGLRCFRCEFCITGNNNLCKNFGIIGASTWGGYAEYTKVSVNNVLHLPEKIGFQEGASFPLVYQTSWHMLTNRGGLQAGDDVLIMAAGSGIGSAAVQIAKLAGAKVIATAGSEEKVKKLEELNPDYIINHSKEDTVKRVMDITKDRGVDIVFEHIGPATFLKSLQSLKKNGKMILCGATTGPEVTFDLRYLYSRQLTMHGSIMGTRQELMKITSLVEAGIIKPVIDSVFALNEASKAHERMESRKHFGKIVLENK